MILLLFVQISLTFFSQNSLLVLNSYNPGLSWSDEELNGLFSVLNNREDLEVYVEYLDAKGLENLFIRVIQGVFV